MVVFTSGSFICHGDNWAVGIDVLFGNQKRAIIRQKMKTSFFFLQIKMKTSLASTKPYQTHVVSYLSTNNNITISICLRKWCFYHKLKAWCIARFTVLYRKSYINAIHIYYICKIMSHMSRALIIFPLRIRYKLYQVWVWFYFGKTHCLAYIIFEKQHSIVVILSNYLGYTSIKLILFCCYWIWTSHIVGCKL